jgi:uncharacterized membrane protein YphA (DoxX/SURF4 family)
MQRSFSSFPNSRPGISLLGLRILLACNALSDSINAPVLPTPFGVALCVALALTGAGLLVGLWTPVCALLLATFECYAALMGPWDLHSARVAVSVCVAMLGPGAWSLDARLYGRKVIMADTDL